MQYDPDARNIVVIGASAGGIEALMAFFREVPADLAAAVLVVLHIPPDARSDLARVLGRCTSLPVKSAEDGEAITPGQVYVASADRHLMVQDNRIRITRGPREGRARPSIDVLFRSASLAYGARVMAIVMSGALDDGTAGAWAVKDRGGLVLVQDPSEALISSMPESAIRHVEVDHVAPVAMLARTVAGLIGSPASAKRAKARPYHEVETAIAAEGNGLQAGVMDIGAISKYTFPDCHGVLVQMTEGSIVRYRCHTGHAFSLMSLLSEVNEAIDTGLWDALRAIEERIMLVEQMGELELKAGRTEEAEKCRVQARDAKIRLRPIREMVLDSKFFGHDENK